MSYDEIIAPPNWHCVDFISDLHLQESEPANFLAWRAFLEKSPADAIFILGDLFDIWVGDDAISTAQDRSLIARHEGLHFEDRCCRVLHFCAQRRNVYFLHGNRDFLLGSLFAKASGIQLISDPSVLSFAGQRYLLSHGDALCLQDTEYQTFRTMVRSPAWQQNFLATPLQERLQQARMMRQTSQARRVQQVAVGQAFIDIDPQAAVQWMDATQTQHFIHGHTHEGKHHPITSAAGAGMRYVLPDWDLTQEPVRGHALRLSRSTPSQALGSMPNKLQTVIAQQIAVV